MPKATPSSVTKSFLDAIITKDKTILEGTSQWDMQQIAFLEMHDGDYVKGISKTLQEKVHKVLYDFDYEILEEKIDDDVAKVIINFKSKDIYEALLDAQTKAEKKIKELFRKNPNYSSKKIHQEIMNILYHALDDITKTKEYTIPINLKLIDGKWQITNDNKELEEALLENANEFVTIMNQ